MSCCASCVFRAEAMKGNIFFNTPESVSAEVFETLQSAPGVCIERIISRGQCSPDGFWYDQDDDEWVLVLSGKARLMFEGGEVVEMFPGDYLNIPAHKKHRVAWTDPAQNTVWLAVHYSMSAAT